MAQIEIITPNILPEQFRWRTPKGAVTPQITRKLLEPVQQRPVGQHFRKVYGSFYRSLLVAYQAHLKLDGSSSHYSAPLPPGQMFLRPNRNTMPIKLKPDDLNRAAQLIKKHQISLYAHAPYLINLCRPVTQKSIQLNETEPWALRVLREDLQLMQALGGRGVVVHLGNQTKSSGLSLEEALDVMYQSIMTVFSATSAEVPLLLETSSGAGGELCADYEQFRDFYRRFTPYQQTRVKICVDTCHVWAAGHQPMDFLTCWEQEVGRQSIALIHYNDSAESKGSKLDRHATPGTGQIGPVEMTRVLDWAQPSNGSCHPIDLVVE